MYTIQLLNGDIHRLERLREALITRIQNDGRFSVSYMTIGFSTVPRRERREAGLTREQAWQIPTLFLRNIRLTKPKPYCGNHPGPCEIPDRPKPNARLLEWDDWVAFHKLVNGLFNQRKVRANIWTLPHDVSGKMWIRKGLLARVKWDWTEESSPRFNGRNIRIWNQGTPDQFEP
jgi:hypothetical protein